MEACVILHTLLICALLVAHSFGAEPSPPGLRRRAIIEANATDTRRELEAMAEQDLESPKLRGCGNGNPSDDCWQCDAHWYENRQRLSYCAIGFGRNAMGGRNGEIYVVTDPEHDDPVNPEEGTLRHAVLQEGPLWIVFDRDMHIKLEAELIMTSYKTIDGRGVDVHIDGGGCITMQRVHHIIIHGIHIHDCKVTGPQRVRSSMTKKAGRRGSTDGDGINIWASSNIWIDHCSFARCADGLIDAIHGSDLITISNNYFSHHNKVMLLGADDADEEDRLMKVTVAFNYFGPGLIQRMPRCRFGIFHILNNYYSGWDKYAIGGSSGPTIDSEGNYFVASGKKKIVKNFDGCAKSGDWRSAGDMMLNGAVFDTCGAATTSSLNRKTDSIFARNANQVPRLTQNAGPSG